MINDKSSIMVNLSVSLSILEEIGAEWNSLGPLFSIITDGEFK